MSLDGMSIRLPLQAIEANKKLADELGISEAELLRWSVMEGQSHIRDRLSQKPEYLKRKGRASGR